ncbi:MAG TPA: hypothetical protein DF614_06555, partial [Methylococcaceae bacterium]|nr:hypothetical protein [Methylococcaceae bacterium]
TFITTALASVTVNGGTGTDTIAAVPGTLNTATFQDVETITASAGLTGSVYTLTGASATTISVGTTAQTVTNLSSATTTVTAAATTTILTTGAATGNYAITGGVAMTTITATGSSGTLNITSADATGNALAIAAGSGNITVAGAGTTDTITVTGLATANQTFTGTTAAAVTAKFVVTDGAGAQTIVTGSGADTITSGAGADTITGGAGLDRFVFSTTSTGTPTDTNFDTITDFTKTAGANLDTIAATALILGMQTATAGAGVATITSGLATFDTTDTSLAQHLAAVAAALQATAGATAIWQEGSDAFVYISDGTLGVGATDVLIKLTGVTAGALTISGNAITGIA